MDKRQLTLVLWAGIALAAVAVILVAGFGDEPASLDETATDADAPGATSGVPLSSAGGDATTPSDTDPTDAAGSSGDEPTDSTEPSGTAPTAPDTSEAAPATAPTPTAPASTVPSTTATSAAGAVTTSSTAASAPAPSTTATGAGGPAPTLLIEGSPMTRFSVAVGAGVDLDRDELARSVIATLSDERSWRGRGHGFELVDSGGQFTLIVATPAEVDRMCSPLRTNGYFSCSSNGWVALNSDRWFGATSSWTAGLTEYRHYLVNHEIGHQLGQGHVGCPGAGQPAPVMMQQTKGVGACLPNGWVDP